MFIKEQQSIVVTRKCWGCVFTNIILMLCQYCDQWIKTLLITEPFRDRNV